MLSDDSIGTYDEQNQLRQNHLIPHPSHDRTTLHIDYTGRLPELCETGTLYFLVACHGAYIHLESLNSLQGPETATAITAVRRRILLTTWGPVGHHKNGQSIQP
jgi:hypothetical protein